MSDPNTNPRPGGSGNIIWIVVAVLVVIAVIWYAMRGGNEPATITEPPAATTEAPAVESTDPLAGEGTAIDAPAPDDSGALAD